MAPVLRHCPCLRPENDDVRLLDYSHSNLEDVPNEVFGFERTLEELYLDANQIKDLPRPLFHCHGLRKLNLSDNEVQTLPPAVASLINLEQLDISKNGVLEIPDNIKGCKCLNVIDASVNPLGKLPEGFTQLINLQELYLNDTFLEYLPANFGRLSRLKILELRENHLKVLPKSMARLTELNRLDIGQNDFADLPEVIGNLPRLIELWCDCNNLSCLPPFIGGLKKLAYLDASKNRIYEVAEEIEGCTSLCDLTLSTNRIKELPEGIANLKKLTVMRVDENRLITLPVNIGNLCNLEELVASSNDLEKLPLSIGLLRNLHTLIADDNLLEELPYEMGSCVKLTILSLRDNKLVQIPDELGHITALKVINLSGNLLQYLPFSIAKLPNLQALWLSENQNKPLIPLQSDTDKDTGQKVLTCFMLPQAPLDEDRCNEVEGAEVEATAEGKEGRHLIKFAFDTEPDQPSKLVRAPTPYPKELKAHARHARNYALKKQGSKDSEGNEVVEQNIHNTQLLQKPQKCDIPSTAATPDIMIMTSGAPETRIKVKEAIVTKPKSPISSPPLHEKHGLQDYKDKSLNEKSNLQQLNSSDQNLPKQGNQESSGDMLATEIPPKVLGRRDSRGDGSSSEKSSTSPAGSPKSTVEGAQLEAQTANAKECRFKKNTTATGSKRESWMRQRLLRQGSGDSDRGYRSDHELYLAERDQYGHLYTQHDGYASDWEAFLAKQNYSGSGGPIPMVHQYTRPPSGGQLGYRGNAEGQEIQSEGERAYWDSERYFPDGREEGHPDERYSRVPLHQSYWQKEPSPVSFYPYDMSQSYQPSPEESRGYYYPRDTRAEMVSLQPQGYFNESAGYPQAHPWPQRPHGGASPRTLPKRLSGSSPRLKRAQCISVQAPLHSSPQEYHLMPQPPPNIRHPSPGSSPRPGRSPSPRMDSRASAPCYPPPVHPKYAPVNPHLQPKYPGHPYPITTQPVNSVHLPPPPQHPPYYGPYEHAASTYPVMPPSPRMKHVAQPYVVTSEDPTQSRSYNTLTPPTVHSSNYYSSSRLSPSNQGEMAGPATIINQYSPTARNAQYGQESEAAREFTYGAVPVHNSEYGVDLSSNLQYHSGPVSGPKHNVQYSGDELGENTAQYLNRPVPSINIIPSTSPPQASYILSESMEQPHNTWKENSTQEFVKATPCVEENHSRPVSYSEDHAQQNSDLHHVHSVSSVNSYNSSSGSNKPDSGSNLIHSSLPPLSTSSPISSDVINQQSSVTSDSSVISPSNITHPSSSCNTSLRECKKAHYALIDNRSNQEMPTKQKNPEEKSEPRMKSDFNAALINSSNRNEQLVVSEDGTNFNEIKDPGNENIQHISDHHVQNVHFVLAPEIRRAHSVPVQDEKNVNVPCVANMNVQHLTSSANKNDQLFASDGNGVFQAVPLSHNSKISPHVSSLDQSSRIKQPVNILPSVSLGNQSLSESNVEGNSKYGKIAAPKPLSENKTVKYVTKVQSLSENKTAQKHGISQSDKMSLPQSILAPSGKNVHQLPSFPDGAKSYSTVLNDKNICPVSVIKESRNIPLASISSDNRSIIQTTVLNAKNNKPIPGIRSVHQVANIDEKDYRETVHLGSTIADGKSFHQTTVSDGNNSDSNSVVSYVTNAHATIPVTKNVHTIAAAPGEINKPVVSSTLECINMHHVSNKTSSTIAHPVSNILDSRNTYPISTVSDSRKLHSVPIVSHNNSHIISVAPSNKNTHSVSNTKNTNQIVQLSTNEENLAHPVQVLSNQNIHLSSSVTTNMLASDNRNVMQACLKYDGAVSTENTKAIQEYLCNRNVQSSMPTQNHFVDSTRHYQITGQQSNKQNQPANQEAKEKLIMQMPCSKYIHQQNPTNSSKNTHTSVSNNDNPVNIICTSSIQTQKDMGKLHLHEKGQNIPKSSSDKNNSHAKAPVSDKRFQKVLPPFDKTHHLRPSSARNIPKDDSSKELHCVMEQKFNVPDVTQTDYKKETPQNFHSQQIQNIVPVDENYSNIPPVLPPKPNFVSASNVGQEKSHQSKPPPAIPPKPASMSGSITDTGIQPNIPLDTNISTDTVITILPYDHAEHNINTTAKNSTDLSVSKNMQQKGNMPDLLSRIGPEEKGHLILIGEDKSNSSKLILKEEMEEKFSKDKMALSSEIITHDEDNNMTNATEDNFPDSPKSPKRNSWFFGAHKNSLVFPVIILKNPGLGFTIEGGIGSPRNPNRPGDNGIYVAQVVTNGPASSALRPGDKILQVDGIDFTRLDNGKASAVLQDTGPTVSLMVSRE